MANPVDGAAKLPWKSGSTPLMLAPMQGITNRGLRSVFIQWVRPDAVFTELSRVRPGAKQPLSDNDLQEILGHSYETPLVVQLIGCDLPALLAAADVARHAGIIHVNINMGCPFGRMTSKSAGGALLKEPSAIKEILGALRPRISGSLSVKMRAGFDDPQQVFSLLPLFADIGIDFVILHPRTVRQRYTGHADHTITAAAVRRTSLPLIANGDITKVAEAFRVLESTGAAGLMLGRGAIGDPVLFQRIRGEAAAEPTRDERAAELRYYLVTLLEYYRDLFCGDTQVLCKMKAVITYVCDPHFTKYMKGLKRSKNLAEFARLIQGLE
jgi:tRNA-dihydrouridine synthase